jgi:hypothetical protein
MGHAGHRNVAGSGHSEAGAPERRLRCFGRQRKSDGRDEPLGGNRVVTPMAVTPAGFALFLDVTDFAAGRHFSIAADDAAARQSGEPEKSNKAHDVFNLSLTSSANLVPLSPS